jgi:glycosyltransferase involved in cell wall biosynthesis
MNFVFIADFFSDQVLGGGEINNEVLIDSLLSRGHKVKKLKSSLMTEQDLKDNFESCFIISNFIQLNPALIDMLKELKYVIYEHDHKYLRNRNPALFVNYKAPQSEIINYDFYRNAMAVLCQSKFHCDILQKNINLDNVKNLSGNLWSEESLEVMKLLSQNQKKDRFSIMKSGIRHKNTDGAVKYCEKNAAEYELISSSDYHDFLAQLSRNNKFVFLPQTPETLSRVVVEARMLGVEVHVNNKIGAASEEWFHLKGIPLINFMRQRREDIVSSVEEVFSSSVCNFFTPKRNEKKISILTSMYNGDDQIAGFLEDITSQTVFSDCELIIIDANSPGNEKEIIELYQKKYPNIIYKRLERDPGIYGCWNAAIEMSSGEYITNANLDDRRSRQQIEIFANALDENPEVDLVYSHCYVTSNPNERFNSNSSNGNVYPITPFSPQAMIKCLPGCMPLWRKGLHSQAGLFDQSYTSAGDWEMWLRAVRGGSVFKMLDGVHGLYYNNPKGISTDKSKEKKKHAEEKRVFFEYTDVFGESVTNQYTPYFKGL